MAKRTKTEIEKLERKLEQIRSGKWSETPARVKQLESRLAELKS